MHSVDNRAGALQQDLRSLWFLADFIILVFFGFGGYWVATTPLASSALAAGAVAPDGRTRAVSHLEGGIVSEIRARVGDEVRQGEVLAVFDQKQALARHRAATWKRNRLQLTRRRLIAQIEERDHVALQKPASSTGDPSFDEFLENEMRAFALNATLRTERAAAMEAQKQQVEREIDSHTYQIRGGEKQIKLVKRELESKRRLLKRGLTTEPVVFALERKAAELRAESDSIAASRARAKQKIAELNVALANARTEMLNEHTRQLALVNTEITQVEESLAGLSDVLERRRVLAPVSGRVLESKIRSPGEVVQPGDAFMTITPLDEELVIEARLEPLDVESVAIGDVAQVRFSSLSARHRAPVLGRVSMIGSDVVVDNRTGASYYPLRVKVDGAGLRGERVDLIAGMPAEVYINTGEHTPLEYMLEPVLASLQNAFREGAVAPQ